MISVVIPTLNAAERLPACLSALVPAAVDGLVKEVIVSDGGSIDATEAIADEAGARFIAGEKGRGGQLKRGAAAARGDWHLFLHADTRLDPAWPAAAAAFIADENRAGVFRLRFDSEHWMARLVETGANLRARLLAAPYGDQGLLISRSLYERIGGYSDCVLFEDVDLIDRLLRARGRNGLAVLQATATTSAARYENDGYFPRIFRNLVCLAMYRAGVAPARIASFYEAR